MAFECDFDFLSPEQNEKFAAFVNEMRDFSDKGGEVVRVSRELRAVTKERDNYKAMLEGTSKACEDMRREYKAFRDGVRPLRPTCIRRGCWRQILNGRAWSARICASG